MNCRLCPRNCGVDRENGETGYCKMPGEIYAARAALHFWEEPCISGENGSGTVFFSGCNLRCVFCQNAEISEHKKGKKISDLEKIFFDLKEKGAHNINLVTPTHYADKIAVAVKNAKKNGLDLPVIYNCGGYESVDTIKSLNGVVDIYLPDFKYVSASLSGKYSNAKDYFTTAKKTLAEMVSQCPEPVIEGGIMKSGVIVRHLILPGQTQDSKRVLNYLYNTYGNKIYISIMNQYTPMNDKFPELNRTVSKEEYSEVVDFAVNLGIENAFLQDASSSGKKYIPEFNMQGL